MPLDQVARDLGLTPSSLAGWVKQARADRSGGKTGLTSEERAEVAKLRKENGELKRERELLKKGLTPARRREIATWAVSALKIAAKRACRLLALQCSTFYRKSTRRDDSHLRLRIRELALARPRYGYRRVHVLLRREGWTVNVKRTYRLYRQEGLLVR